MKMYLTTGRLLLVLCLSCLFTHAQAAEPTYFYRQELLRHVLPADWSKSVARISVTQLFRNRKIFLYNPYQKFVLVIAEPTEPLAEVLQHAKRDGLLPGNAEFATHLAKFTYERFEISKSEFDTLAKSLSESAKRDLREFSRFSTQSDVRTSSMDTEDLEVAFENDEEQWKVSFPNTKRYAISEWATALEEFASTRRNGNRAP